MSALVIFSTFGAISGIILSGPRVYYAMARDGLLFRWVGEIHPRFRTPHRAIVLQALWSSVLVATGTYRDLFIRVIYTEWIFFGAMAIGLFLFRRRGLQRAYSIWGYPMVPLVFIVSAIAIVAIENTGRRTRATVAYSSGESCPSVTASRTAFPFPMR